MHNRNTVQVSVDYRIKPQKISSLSKKILFSETLITLRSNEFSEDHDLQST